ncbi:MAG: hypothetical protein ACO3DQ_04695 [Cephaloticoccus sp.]
MGLRATRIKFIWGASKVITARWRFGLWGYYERKEGHPDSGLAFSVRGILILLLFASVTAYVGGATAVYLRLERRPPNYVTYTDILLLPIRKDEVRAKRGQAYLDAGIAAMKQQRWSEGEMQLRLGLSRYPQAMPARLALAEFYFLIQQNDRALAVLAEGMDAVPGYPGRRYLTNYLTIAGQGQDTGAIIEACNRYLDDAAINLPEKEREWLLQQKLGALIADGQTEEAMAILAGVPDSLAFNEHRVLVMIAMGRTEEAADARVPGYHAVNARKKRVVLRAARAYLRGLASPPRHVRFDVVEVALPREGAKERPVVRHFANVPLFPKDFRPGG